MRTRKRGGCGSRRNSRRIRGGSKGDMNSRLLSKTVNTGVPGETPVKKKEFAPIGGVGTKGSGHQAGKPHRGDEEWLTNAEAVEGMAKKKELDRGPNILGMRDPAMDRDEDPRPVSSASRVSSSGYRNIGLHDAVVFEPVSDEIGNGGYFKPMFLCERD